MPHHHRDTFFGERERLDLLIREILAEEREEWREHHEHDRDRDHHMDHVVQHAFRGLSLGADVPATSLFVPPTDGFYEMDLAVVVKVADAGASAAMPVVMSFTTVDLGAANETLAVNLQAIGTLYASGSKYFLLANTPVMLSAVGGGPYGAAKYDLSASARRL